MFYGVGLLAFHFACAVCQDPAVFEPPEEDEETLHEEDEVPEEPFAPEERTPQQVPEERVPEEQGRAKSALTRFLSCSMGG